MTDWFGESIIFFNLQKNSTKNKRNMSLSIKCIHLCYLLLNFGLVIPTDAKFFLKNTEIIQIFLHCQQDEIV